MEWEITAGRSLEQIATEKARAHFGDRVIVTEAYQGNDRIPVGHPDLPEYARESSITFKILDRSEETDWIVGITFTDTHHHVEVHFIGENPWDDWPDDNHQYY